MWIDTLIKPRDIISALILLENPIFHNAQSDRRQMLSNQNELEIESNYSMLCAFGKLTNSFWMIEFRIGLSCLFQIESFNVGICNEKFCYTRRTHSYTNMWNTHICLFICWHCFARTEENEVNGAVLSWKNTWMEYGTVGWNKWGAFCNNVHFQFKRHNIFFIQ